MKQYQVLISTGLQIQNQKLPAQKFLFMSKEKISKKVQQIEVIRAF